MVTYEEFMREQTKKGIHEIELIKFSDSEESTIFADIHGDPSEYLDIAKNTDKLKIIQTKINGTQEFYDSLIEFVKEVNDNVEIKNGNVGTATKDEFFKGEEIITKVISEINPEWTTKQKAAFVHYKMGELISYVPDINFSGKYIDSKTAKNSRNIWKSLIEGKSVCNGITYIQQNILSRLGIKSRELSSPTHSFLLIETEEGNIISDATWDLSKSLYGARPEHFGVAYEELRKREEILSNAHKLENPPEDVIEISDKELREIYHSIGFTNEDRTFKFPLYDIFQEINNEEKYTVQEKTNVFLERLTEKFPEEVKHLQETRNMLEIFIEQLGIQSKDISTRYVYNKDDVNCENPNLILHINSQEMKDKIKILNLKNMNFDDINIDDFDRQFKSHDEDTREPFWKQYIKNKDEVINENQKTNEEKE